MGTPVTAILGLGQEVGDAVARRFCELGHNVMAADPDSDRLEKARNVVPDAVILHHGDLHTRLGLRNCLTTAQEAYGRVDNIVVIPEIPPADALASFSKDAFEKAALYSLRGSALAMRIFAAHLEGQDELPGTPAERVRQRGSVTFILSQSAISTMPGRFTESVTQAAILGAVRVGALELAEQAIRVNAIVAIRPHAEKSDPWIKKRTPLGRAALADEIADAARYLSSPEAAIITGATLTLDGGQSLLSGIIS